MKALGCVFQRRRMMEPGRYATIHKLAVFEKTNLSYVSRLLWLTLLVPDIVEATLHGWQRSCMLLPAPIEMFPVRGTGRRCGP